MSVGTLITVKDGKVVKREPIWPFPPRTSFPRDNADGSVTYFFKQPYYSFKLGEVFNAVVQD